MFRSPGAHAKEKGSRAQEDRQDGAEASRWGEGEGEILSPTDWDQIGGIWILGFVYKAYPPQIKHGTWK